MWLLTFMHLIFFFSSFTVHYKITYASMSQVETNEFVHELNSPGFCSDDIFFLIFVLYIFTSVVFFF